MKVFLCPRCGGTHFGVRDARAAIFDYMCHDQYGHGCHWNGEGSECLVEISETATYQVPGIYLMNYPELVKGGAATPVERK